MAWVRSERVTGGEEVFTGVRAALRNNGPRG